MIIKPLFGELIGTFLLSLVTLAFVSYAGTPGFVGLYVPAGIAAAYALLSALFGSTSGGQLNPSITVGLVALRRVRPTTGAAYVAVQILGAITALFFFRYLSGTTVFTNHATDLRAFVAEMLGATILVWAVVAAGYSRIAAPYPGLTAGLGLFLALSVAQAFSGGIINPAVALAQGSYGVAYLVAPLIGGVLGAFLGRLFSPAPIPQ